MEWLVEWQVMEWLVMEWLGEVKSKSKSRRWKGMEEMEEILSIPMECVIDDNDGGNDEREEEHLLSLVNGQMELVSPSTTSPVGMSLSPSSTSSIQHLR